MVIQAVMTIFKSLGLKCVPYLKHFMPLFMHVMKVVGDSIPGLRELTFQQLHTLVRLIKHYTRDFLDEFFQVLLFCFSLDCPQCVPNCFICHNAQMIKEYWDTPSLMTPIITLIEEMARSLNDEIKSALKWIIPKMLKILNNDPSPSNNATIHILHAFDVFDTLIDDYLHLIIPAVVSVNHHNKLVAFFGLINFITCLFVCLLFSLFLYYRNP